HTRSKRDWIQTCALPICTPRFCPLCHETCSRLLLLSVRNISSVNEIYDHQTDSNPEYPRKGCVQPVRDTKNIPHSDTQVAKRNATKNLDDEPHRQDDAHNDHLGSRLTTTHQILKMNAVRLIRQK